MRRPKFRALQWRKVFAIPIAIIPIVATAAYVGLSISFGFVSPTDDMCCDSTSPEWYLCLFNVISPCIPSEREFLGSASLAPLEFLSSFLSPSSTSLYIPFSAYGKRTFTSFVLYRILRLVRGQPSVLVRWVPVHQERTRTD
jgi:hypothetical protein